MPVVINEFEIILEPPEAPEQPEGPAPQPEEASPPQVLRPEDVARVYQHHLQRMARVWAD